MEKNEFVAHGAAHITNTGGIEVMLTNDGETLSYRHTDSTAGPGIPVETEIQHFECEQDGEPFDECYEGVRSGFETNQGVRFYLDEFMSV